jgi:hypothetical protein
MPFVLDCSMTMAWVFSDESGASTDGLRDSLIKDSAIVPCINTVYVSRILC